MPPPVSTTRSCVMRHWVILSESGGPLAPPSHSPPTLCRCSRDHCHWCRWWGLFHSQRLPVWLCMHVRDHNKIESSVPRPFSAAVLRMGLCPELRGEGFAPMCPLPPRPAVGSFGAVSCTAVDTPPLWPTGGPPLRELAVTHARARSRLAPCGLFPPGSFLPRARASHVQLPPAARGTTGAPRLSALSLHSRPPPA